MIQIVESYNNYIESLPNLISSSYYKAEYFINNLGLKRVTYYRKLRERNFTMQEVQKITELLFPEEVLQKSLRQSEEDIKQGNVMSYEDFSKKSVAKYGF